MEDVLERAYATRAVAVIVEALEDLHPEMLVSVKIDENTREISVALADGPIRMYSPHPDAAVRAN